MNISSLNIFINSKNKNLNKFIIKWNNGGDSARLTTLYSVYTVGKHDFRFPVLIDSSKMRNHDEPYVHIIILCR